jgi:hypothetical protein
MTRRRRPWIVTPHRPIEKIAGNLWAVEGAIPGLSITRRMFIVRRSDGGLLFSGAAIPLDEATLAEVLAWGRPAMLVVPHDWHMVDAHAFAHRLAIPIFGPDACLSGLRRRADIAGTLQDIPPDPTVVIESLAGTRKAEPVLIVTHPGGGEPQRSALFADAIQNTPPALLNLPLRLLGFGGGPKMTPAFRVLFTRDRLALSNHLRRLSALPGLSRLVPCHGPIVDRDAPAALRAAAGSP